jgi:hypothetical protein
MRLKEVSNNYRASGLRARDARHVHNGPSVPKHRSGKNTRRWCGGKVGREHKSTCMVKRTWNDKVRWYVLACTECGKELDHYYPLIGILDRPKPDWVVEEEA